MKILKLEQGSEEWLEARKGKVTGSKLKGIIVKRGTKKKLGFYELLADRMSMAEDYENPMERGTRLEEEALEMFEKVSNKKLERVGLCVSDFNPNIAVSPDALIKKGKKYTEAVEVKCLSSARHLQTYYEDEIPSDYEEQVIQYFIVNEDLKKLYFVCYDPRITALPIFAIEVERGDVKDKIKTYREYQEACLLEIDEMLEELTF